MGLDWCLGTKVRDDENAEEVADLQQKLEEVEDDIVREQLKQKLRPLIVTPLEELGAKPLSLDDPETVEAFRGIWESFQEPIKNGDFDNNPAAKAHWSRPFDEVVKDHVGSILTNMVKPEYEYLVEHNRGNPFASLSGLESFRGKRVQYCTLIPDELQSEAFENMEPEQMIAYAGRLEEHLDRKAYDDLKEKAKRIQEISFDEILGMRAKPGHEEEFEQLQKELESKHYWHMHTLDEAVTWLRFWGERGFPMHAWY